MHRKLCRRLTDKSIVGGQAFERNLGLFAALWTSDRTRIKAGVCTRLIRRDYFLQALLADGMPATKELRLVENVKTDGAF